MKLLAKNTLYLVVFSLLVFTAGGFIFFYNLRAQIYDEVDQSLVLEKDRIIQKLMLTDTMPQFYTSFENQIRVETREQDKAPFVRIKDTLIYDSIENDFIPFRKLKAHIHLYTKAYEIDVSKSLINKDELLRDVFILMLSLFVALMLILLIVNFFISKRTLRPFYATLEKIKDYKITHAGLKLPGTRTREFTLLNEVLNIMSEKIYSDYLSLKEFTENASHEMQTPLSVIRAKIETLIQDESLTCEQVKLVQSIYDSVNKLSKLNRALILLARIGNLQFREKNQIRIDQLADKILDNFSELITEKNICLTRNYENSLIVCMNMALADVFLTNLIGNAVKHNLYGGKINLAISGNTLIISNTGNPLVSQSKDMFRRFSKDSVNSESLGLGLAIVKKIAETNNIFVDYKYKDDIHMLTAEFGNCQANDPARIDISGS